MKEGYAVWKSSYQQPIYYATDGTRHGETHWKWKASVITEDRFKLLLDKWLIPSSAKFVENK